MGVKSSRKAMYHIGFLGFDGSFRLKQLFFITLFLSSFLLFAIQPMYAKLILPNLGGGSSVWTACMLFFQTLLLVGYGYSYLLSRLKSVTQQLVIHCGLILLGLLFMPLASDWSTSEFLDLQSPYLNVFLLLFSSIGLPYLLLSTSAPLLQHWMSQSDAHASTYKLYSISNLAALLALFSYPFIIEHQFALATQTHYWSLLFALFAISIVASAWVFKKHHFTWLQQHTEGTRNEDANLSTHQMQPAAKLTTLQLLTWVLLSAVGVLLLVSTTSKMTQNIPPIPFLWILPLAAYLITFILTFHNEKFYQRTFWVAAFSVLSIIALLLFFIGSQFGVTTQVILYLLIMFAGTMICHGELFHSRPNHNHLTLFYFIISLGGCIGSVFASLIATQWFVQYNEFIYAIIAVFGLVAISNLVATQRSKTLITLNILIAVSLIGGFQLLNRQFTQFDIYQSRNFYGTLAVKDITTVSPQERRLVDGYTAHGSQPLIKADKVSKQDITPLSYYRPQSGIGLMLSGPLSVTTNQIGLVGLGAGALAYYGKSGDSYTFYELNPDVIHVAKTYFDYLSTSAAEVEVKQGDARIVLEHEADLNKNYDALIIDAFSSDAIPVHLLTEEAIALYASYLNEQGSLFFHISNSYLDLKPVMSAIGKQLNMPAVYFVTQPNEQHDHQTEWVMFTANTRLLTSPVTRQYGDFDTINDLPALVWRDDFSSLLSVLKTN